MSALRSETVPLIDNADKSSPRSPSRRRSFPIQHPIALKRHVAREQEPVYRAPVSCLRRLSCPHVEIISRNALGNNPLVLGSVKGNVGHSGAVSGALSLFKLQNYPLAGHLQPVPAEPAAHPLLRRAPIRIGDERQWSSARHIAVVSNFGATGYAGYIRRRSSRALAPHHRGPTALHDIRQGLPGSPHPRPALF